MPQPLKVGRSYAFFTNLLVLSLSGKYGPGPQCPSVPNAVEGLAFNCILSPYIWPPRCNTVDLVRLNCICTFFLQLYTLSALHIVNDPSNLCVICKLTNQSLYIYVKAIYIYIYITNSSGPSTEPCGTPLVTDVLLESCPSTTTLWYDSKPVLNPYDQVAVDPVHLNLLDQPTMGDLLTFM